jgi:hypothetical protein
MCYETQPAAAQKMVVDFLRLVTHDGGQQYSLDLHCAPLPAEVAQRVEKKLQTIKAAP